MSRVTLPVVLIAAAALWPAGASASTGFVPSGPAVAGVYHQSVDARHAALAAEAPAQGAVPNREVQATNAQPSASDGFDWADAGIVAAVALALLGMAGGTLLLATRTRRRTA